MVAGDVLMILTFIGTAGSGKTTITSKFGRYLENRGHKVSYVNLDTGVKNLPYNPDVDVRERITTEELMRDGYGPNGAIVESYDRLMMHFEEYLGRVLELSESSDYVLIDTPGQMEMFLFHEFGVELMENLHEPLVIYLFDPKILKKSRDYCFVRFFSVMIELRLGSTTVPALNKIDLVEKTEKYRVYLEDVNYLADRLRLDPSMQGFLAYKLCSLLPEILPPVRILYLSAKTGEGFEDLETIAHEHRCTCGDLT